MATDPKKKKRKVVGYKTVVKKGKVIDKGEPFKASVKGSVAETKKTYKKGDERTGAKEYGPESKTKPTPKFVTDEQDKKNDFAHKDGKKYRAGYTSTEIKPGAVKVSLTGKPQFKMPDTTEKVPVYAKSKSSSKKLKPKAMTYGTDSPKKGGGTKYDKKVRVRLK